VCDKCPEATGCTAAHRRQQVGTQAATGAACTAPLAMYQPAAMTQRSEGRHARLIALLETPGGPADDDSGNLMMWMPAERASYQSGCVNMHHAEVRMILPLISHDVPTTSCVRMGSVSPCSIHAQAAAMLTTAFAAILMALATGTAMLMSD
jgi:hypothetical protein